MLRYLSLFSGIGAFEKSKAVPTSNAQLYKQAGNSIVVDVLEELMCMMLDEENNLLI